MMYQERKVNGYAYAYFYFYFSPPSGMVALRWLRAGVG
jgi:hypothetical protein